MPRPAFPWNAAAVGPVPCVCSQTPSGRIARGWRPSNSPPETPRRPARFPNSRRGTARSAPARERPDAVRVRGGPAPYAARHRPPRGRGAGAPRGPGASGNSRARIAERAPRASSPCAPLSRSVREFRAPACAGCGKPALSLNCHVLSGWRSRESDCGYAFRGALSDRVKPRTSGCRRGYRMTFPQLAPPRAELAGKSTRTDIPETRSITPASRRRRARKTVIALGKKA